MASAYVDIDLKEFDADDLIEALKYQNLDKGNIEELLEMIYDEDEFTVVKGIDKIKLDIIKKIIDKYSIIELQDMLKEPIRDTKTLPLYADIK